MCTYEHSVQHKPNETAQTTQSTKKHSVKYKKGANTGAGKIIPCRFPLCFIIMHTTSTLRRIPPQEQHTVNTQS